MKRNVQSIIMYMKPVEKKVIRNKGTEDCYTATYNQAVLHTFNVLNTNIIIKFKKKMKTKMMQL